MLSTRAFVRNLIKVAPFNVQEGIVKSSGNYSAAAVACIIRVNVNKKHNIVDSLAELQCEDFLHECVSDDNVSVFFIKRAIRERDAWSGHIAFPGGYLNENESDLDAVKREVMEEVGVDLNHAHVHWLGRLTTKTFGRHNEKTIIPHVFLFLNLSDGGGGVDEEEEGAFKAMELNHTEVEAVKWVDMRHFLETDTPAKFVLPTRSMRPDYWELTHAALGLLGLDKLYFPCFKLGGAEITEPKTVPAQTAPPTTTPTTTPTSAGDVSGGGDLWMLWGMTYSFICDLLNTPHELEAATTVEPDRDKTFISGSSESNQRISQHARGIHTDAHTDTHSRLSRRMFRDVVFAQVDNPVFNVFLNLFHRTLRKTCSERAAMASNSKRVVAYSVASALCVYSIGIGGMIYISSYFW